MSIPGEASSAMALLVQASPIDSINCLPLAVGASVVRSGMLHRDRSLYPRASRARSKSAIVVTWQGMRPRPKDSSVQKALPLEMASLVFDTQMTSEIRVVSHPRRLKSIMKNITGQSKEWTVENASTFITAMSSLSAVASREGRRNRTASSRQGNAPQ